MSAPTFPILSADWQGPECQMCYGAGVARMNPGSGAIAVWCPACNGHGREPSTPVTFGRPA